MPKTHYVDQDDLEHMNFHGASLFFGIKGACYDVRSNCIQFLSVICSAYFPVKDLAKYQNEFSGQFLIVTGFSIGKHILVSESKNC